MLNTNVPEDALPARETIIGVTMNTEHWQTVQ